MRIQQIGSAEVNTASGTSSLGSKGHSGNSNRVNPSGQKSVNLLPGITGKGNESIPGLISTILSVIAVFAIITYYLDQFMLIWSK